MIEKIVEKSEWQPHSVRGAIAGRRELTIVSERSVSRGRPIGSGLKHAGADDRGSRISLWRHATKPLRAGGIQTAHHFYSS
jgi:hypothetical protein